MSLSIDAVLSNLKDKLPKDEIFAENIKAEFQRLSDSKKQEAISQIPMLDLKNPAFVFWVGNVMFGAFGVARFMIGDKKLGIYRLLFIGVYIIFAIMAATALTLGSYNLADIIHVITASLIIVAYVWWIVDLFLVGKKLRQKNYEKIMQILK